MTPPAPSRRSRIARAPLVALAAAGLATAAIASESPHGLAALDDGELSSVSGRDGLAFNFSGLSLSPQTGSTPTLTYTTPGGASSLTLTNFHLSRNDDPSPFTDPYYLSIVSNPGLADIIRLQFPQNPGLTQAWQFGGNLSVIADGITMDLGELSLKNLNFQGGGLDVSTIPGTQGIGFGLSLKFSLDALTLQPRGAADTTEMLTVAGLKLSNSDGVSAWALSDVTRQPGIFNTVIDTDGTPVIHLQLGWPTSTATPVPEGMISIDKIAFQSNGITTDLGSSRIGGIQINFMDVKLKPGP